VKPPARLVPNPYRALAVVVVVVGFVLAATTTAFAWVVSTPYPQTVRIEREIGDYSAPSTRTVLVYFSSSIGPTQAQANGGSWDETGSGTPFVSGVYYTVDFDANSWAVDLNTFSYASALVVTPDTTSTLTARTLVSGLNSRTPVTLVTPTGAAVSTLPVSFVSTASVAISSMPTMSLAGTQTVTIGDVTSPDVLVLMGLCALFFGSWLWSSLRGSTDAD